jgi:orotate phosphoribosyltransferase
MAPERTTDSLAAALAGDLLRIGAVALSPNRPFTWASGLRSPIYCDNRLTLGHPSVRRRIADGFVSVLQSTGLRPDVVAGTATAGIPHAAWLADRLDLPMVYVRSAAKGHGKARRVEGPLAPGSRVVLVEDLVSTGMSSIAAIGALREEGADVAAVLAVFSYGLPESRAAFAAERVDLHVLTSFGELLAAARAMGSVDEAQARSLAAWHADPRAWSEAVGA